jgi:hypothetical protein
MQRVADVERPHLFTVEEYMGLEIETRTELLGGVVYDMSPRYSPHMHAVRTLNRLLTHGLFDSNYTVQTQDPIAVSGWRGRDCPEVDVAVLVRKPYKTLPTAADAYMFIEVSDTSYALPKTGDRTYKIPLYVRSGVPSWIVNIPLRHVEYYETAADLELLHGRVFAEGETIDILGIAIPVTDLFLEAEG